MNLQRAVWLYRPATSDSISIFELTALNCSPHNQSWLTIVTSVCQKNENKWEVANVLVLFTELISVSCKIQINSFVVRCWPACSHGAYLRAPVDRQTLVGAGGARWPWCTSNLTLYKNKISNLKYRNLMWNCFLIGTSTSATKTFDMALLITWQMRVLEKVSK